jgi:hypothetical protein
MLALIDSPYAKTPDAVYSVFHHVKARVPSARYGGAYVRKPGFHSSVEDNLASWPDNYSIREAINRRDPRTVTRALDITLSDADMRTLTRRLAEAAARNDPRLAPLREFFGTLDNRTVYGRAHRGPDAPWYAATADSSHLWHLHLSFLTPYADDWVALAGIVSVLIGQSLADYLAGGIMQLDLPKHGDKGTWVGFFQRLVIDRGATLPQYGPDNAYGDEFASALRWWWKNIVKSTWPYDGRAITSDVARHLMGFERTAPVPIAPTQAQVDAAVAKFLTANPVQVPTGVSVNLGTVTGVLFDRE